MTTQPAPATLKRRSTIKRAGPSAACGCQVAARCSSAARRAATPGSPSWLATTDQSGAAGQPASATQALTCSANRCCCAASARSQRVSTTPSSATPSSCKIARCSRVCGMMPSSAATTSSAISTPATPASMVPIKRSWPGTSIKPSGAQASCANQANPSSMVNPRRFSSASRSVSTPVRA